MYIQKCFNQKYLENDKKMWLNAVDLLEELIDNA